MIRAWSHTPAVGADVSALTRFVIPDGVQAIALEHRAGRSEPERRPVQPHDSQVVAVLAAPVNLQANTASTAGVLSFGRPYRARLERPRNRGGRWMWARALRFVAGDLGR